MKLYGGTKPNGATSQKHPVQKQCLRVVFGLLRAQPVPILIVSTHQNWLALNACTVKFF